MNIVFTIEQHLWLHNRHESSLLSNGGVTGKTPRTLTDSVGGDQH